MSRIARTFAVCALTSTLAACVVTRPEPAPSRPRPSAPRIVHPVAPAIPASPAAPASPTPHEIAAERLQQVDGRIDNLHRRIDLHVSHGDYPLAQGAGLHHRLEEIRKEAHDIAGQHGDGLTPGEQRVMNEELDTVAHAAGE